jgi:hypothetical protein
MENQTKKEKKKISFPLQFGPMLKDVIVICDEGQVIGGVIPKKVHTVFKELCKSKAMSIEERMFKLMTEDLQANGVDIKKLSE